MTCYIRHNGSLLKLSVEGYVVHNTRRGSPRMEYTSQITKDMGMKSCRELKNLSLSREAWRSAANQSKD